MVFSKSLCVLIFLEGPVEIGMSLDIASIDAISEINMVLTFCSQCVLGTDLLLLPTG